MNSRFDSAAEKLDQIGPDLTDAGNAERFQSEHGARVSYTEQAGWLVWDGCRWLRNELRVRQLMVETARNIYAEAASIDDRAAQEQIARWAQKSQSARSVKDALYLAQPLLSVDYGDFDADPWLLTVANGTVCLRSGVLRPHTPTDRITRLAPITYAEDATCPLWDAFLERVLPDPDVRAFVHRAVGYSLTGSTREQVLFFCYGIGRNGKSVLIETILLLLAEYGKATRIETLAPNGQSGIPNDVAALAGARVVSVSETPEGRRFDESRVKDLTGGDTVAARFMRQEFFEFRPQFKLWIRGNHQPQITGDDDGIWRRIMLIPFGVQIPESEIDPELPAKLKEELPGIFAWAVRGCLEWQRIGLSPPDAVRAAVSEYRQEQDLIGQFLVECCHERSDASILASDLYRSYGKWVEAHGHRSLSQTKFGSRLRHRGFRKSKSGIVRYFGVTLRGRLDGHGQLGAAAGLSQASEYAGSGGLDSLDTGSCSGPTRARDSDDAEGVSEPSYRPNCKCDGEGCKWCDTTDVKYF